METNPLVSIIMPLYNAEKFVAKAIYSVINQTYTNWELIIVNDGSTDNSIEVAKKYENDKIKVYSQENKGASAARNFGYLHSKGEFIKFFDADDLLSSNMLEEQLSRLIKNPNCITSAQWGRFYHNNISTFKLSHEECWKDMKSIDWICSNWKNAQPMYQPAIFLIPKTLIHKAGLWDERLTLIDDFEYFTRLVLESEMVLFANQSTICYRSGIENSLSGQKNKRSIESAFLSIKLSTEKLLSIENSKLTKLCSANIWQGFIFEFYYQQPNLAKIASDKVNELGGSDLKFPCGGSTKLLVHILGWKFVLKLKSFKFFRVLKP